MVTYFLASAEKMQIFKRKNQQLLIKLEHEAKEKRPLASRPMLTVMHSCERHTMSRRKGEIKTGSGTMKRHQLAHVSKLKTFLFSSILMMT